jgi:porin
MRATWTLCLSRHHFRGADGRIRARKAQSLGRSWNSCQRFRGRDGVVGKRLAYPFLVLVLSITLTHSTLLRAQASDILPPRSIEPRPVESGAVESGSAEPAPFEEGAAQPGAIATALEAANWDVPWLSRILDDQNRGIEVQTIYSADLFTNTRGGLTTRNATRYQGLLDVGVTVPLDQVHTAAPGKLFLLLQSTHGEGLSRNIVGDSLILSDIDSSHNVTQVGEYWWELPLLDETLTFRIGKQDVNSEFIYIDSAEHFIQSSFELTPSSTLPTFPQQSMAAVCLLQINSALQLKLGAWDALAPPGGWGISGNDTVFLASEVEYDYVLNHNLHGTIGLSAGYQTPGSFNEQPVDAVHGYAVQWEQLLLAESLSDGTNPQGLAAFAAYYPRFFGSQRLKESIGDSATAGLVYKGPISGRDHDVAGVGVSWAELFQGGSNQETACELFYRAELAPHVFLQPDFQYIVTPSGIHPDAFVLGLRFQLAL